MGLIVCGWCGHPTLDEAPCKACGHEFPAQPWLQRAQEPPSATGSNAQRLADASAQLVAAGRKVTIEALAELLEVDARTVRRWRQMSA